MLSGLRPMSVVVVDRASASVVILAWNNWPMTQGCLDVLRPTLDVDDEVIVVDNGSTDETPQGLAEYRWVKLVANSTNRGFAGGCNDGAAIATRDVVVFLNNDTLPVGRWLDHLLVPFADDRVGATGPRSNFVSGAQLVADADYSKDRVCGLKAFVRVWEHEHEAMTSPLDRLVGFCLAVRRSAFVDIGGFDEGFGTGGYEDDDLCARLADAGHLLLVAHSSFVHHHGHATFDANGLDWRAIESQNRSLFLSKRSLSDDAAALPTPGPALVVGDGETFTAPVVDALTSLGWTPEVVASSVDIVAELDGRDPRPDLIIAAGVYFPVRGLVWADVPVIAWDCGLPVTRDIEAPKGVAAHVWLPTLLRQLRDTQTFGYSLLECRKHLEAHRLVEAIDAVARAEAIRPNTPQAANAMAVCAHTAGNVGDARAFLHRAIELAPHYGPAHENLAALESSS